MKKYVLLLPFTFLLSACGGNSSDNRQAESLPQTIQQNTIVEAVPAITETVCSYDYTVLNKEESTMPLPDGQSLKKLRVTVEIPVEYSDLGLGDIAEDIKRKEPYEYLFVEFYLPSQPKTGPNYGIAKRTPTENSAVVNYVAPPKAPEQRTEQPTIKKPYDGCKVYGAWNMMGAKVIAYQKNGKCYMVNYYGGSKYSEPERYIKTTFRGRTAFKNAEDPADMYVINANGDLDGYYEGDLATTFGQTTY